MEMKKTAAGFLVSSMMLAGLSASAASIDTTGYVTLSASDAQNTTSFDNSKGTTHWNAYTGEPANLSAGEAPKAGYKYYHTYSMRTPTVTTNRTNGEFVFAGDSLTSDSTLCIMKDETYGIVRVDNYISYRGGIQTWAGGVVGFRGHITVGDVSADKKEPGRLSLTARKENLRIYADIEGENPDSTITAKSENATKADFYPANIWLTGDLSKYKGNINVDNLATLRVGGTTVQGEVSVTSGNLTTIAAEFEGPTFGAVSLQGGTKLVIPATNTFSVGTFTAEAGSTIALAANTTTNDTGRLVISKGFSTTGKVTLDLTDTTFYPKYQEPFPLIRLESGATGELTPEMFEIVNPPVRMELGYGKVAVRTNADGSRELVLDAADDILFYTNPDNYNVNGKDESGFVHATAWQDGELPHEGARYYSRQSIKLPPAKDGGIRTFGGDSLIMDNVNLVNSSANPGYRIDDLHLLASCYVRAWSGVDEVTEGPDIFKTFDLCGKVTMHNASWQFEIYQRVLARVRSEIVGTGNIHVRAWEGATSPNNGPVGFVEFTALNTNYQGRVYVTMNSKERLKLTDGTYVNVPSDLYHTTLIVSDARNLGGPLDTFLFNALSVQAKSVIRTRNDVTFDQANRGIRIVGEGTFEVTNALTTILNPVTYTGVLRKTGAGTLAFGGQARFLNEKDNTPPRVGTNVLAVVEGAVKPLSTNCLDGVKMVFSDGARLVYDMNPADEGMRTVGPVNTKEPENTPIAFAEGSTATRVPVAFERHADDDALTYKVALGTFRDAASAEAFKAKLDVSRTRGCSVTLSVEDATVFATCIPKGFRIIVK